MRKTVESDLHESGRPFTPQEAEVLDKLEIGRNEVVGKMKHDRGKGHTSGPSLRKARKVRIA